MSSSLIEDLTWYKQAAFGWRREGLTVYVDPWSIPDGAPKADLVLITHAHSDHYSKDDIAKVSGPRTVVLAPRDVAKELKGNVKPVAPGDRLEPVSKVWIEAVRAYNIVEERLEFHPKRNNWVGYVIEAAGQTIYHAGDTDHLPELERLKTELALVPIGGTYTMDAGQAAALVKAMRPKLAVPMHFGFVVGSASDGERFRSAAAPIPVEVLKPQVQFARR
jgi:L-ascorbate metabolism protein UlaG (beta-lactamase superfamily)